MSFRNTQSPCPRLYRLKVISHPLELEVVFLVIVNDIGSFRVAIPRLAN